MRKQSAMGSSKYEFDPNQFDIDILNNKKRYDEKLKLIKYDLEEILYQDPIRINETWSMILQNLRQMKVENKL